MALLISLGRVLRSSRISPGLLSEIEREGLLWGAFIQCLGTGEHREEATAQPRTYDVFFFLICAQDMPDQA